MSVLLKAYKDVNGELVMAEEGSFQDLDSIAAGLTRVPGKDVSVSNDLSTNEDLAAKVNQSQIVDDDSFASPSSNQVPSTSSVKSYVDSQVESKDEASEISYDNSTSGLSATDVQAAIDEVEGRVDTNETNITELTSNQDDLITLSGVPENSSDLGTFSGSVIADNVTVKTALSQLESAVSSTRITDVFVVADISARDALTGIDEGDVAIVLDDGTGRRHSYIYDGSSWNDIKTGDQVFTVNGQTDNVVLGTDEVLEGSTNLYHTTARARAAAVVNSTSGSETDQAASVDAMKTYVTDQLALQDEASEISYDNSTSGLTATDVQGALDEIDANVDALAAITKEYVYINQTVAQTGIQAAATPIVFDNTAVNSNGSVFTVNNTNGQITVNKTSTFKLEYILTADTQDGARRTSETVLQVDTGSGFSALSAALGSSTAYGYHRNNASGENSAAGQAILSLTSGDKLRLVTRRSNGSGTIKTVPNGTSLSIEEK